MKLSGSIFAALIIALVMLAAGLVRAADTAPPPMTDKDFIQKIARDGIFVVEAGKIAMDKGASQKVKHIAITLVQDQAGINDALKSLAASRGIELPARLDNSYDGRLDDLDRLWGMAFDLAYLDQMNKIHQSDRALFARAAASSKDGDLKSFTHKTDETCQQHDAAVRELQSALLNVK